AAIRRAPALDAVQSANPAVRNRNQKHSLGLRLTRALVAARLQFSRSVFDVIIIGGGPAGLSAALVLARCRRTLLLCDAGQPRNARSSALHGFLTPTSDP